MPTDDTAQRPSGLYLESTPDERLGVLPGEERVVQDVMSRDIVSIEASRSLKDAADTIRNRHVPALVVTRNHRPVGILTEHDLVVYGLTRGMAPTQISVEQVLGNREPIFCPDNAILNHAMRLMADHRLQSVPVQNADGRVVGILSLMDVAGAVMPNVAATWLARVRKETGAPDQTRT
jgi:CBS domain-containing protein